MNSPSDFGHAEDPEGAGGAISSLDRALQVLDRWSERVSWELFRFGLYVTMPALVGLVSLDVTLRYVFNAPLQWARDVNGILLLITIFSALPHAWDRAYHIRMEVFYSRFSGGRKRVADILSSVSGVVFFGFMAIQGGRFVPFMIQTGETGEDLDFPLWPFMGVLAFCAAVVAARVFSNPAGVERHLRHPSVADVESGDGQDGWEGPDGGDGGEGEESGAGGDAREGPDGEAAGGGARPEADPHR